MIHACSESNVAKHLGIKGAWRPQGPFKSKILWPAIYVWRVPFIGRPFGGAVCPDLDMVIDTPQVRTLTYAGAGWLAGQTGGSYAPWIDRLKIQRLRLKFEPFRHATKVPLVCMVYEEGRPIDFGLLHSVCREPEMYDAQGVRIVDIRDNPQDSVFQRFARLWDRIEVVAPEKPEQVVEAIGRCTVYVEVQHTLEPTLWALIAQTHRTLIYAPPYLGWQEWFRNDKNFMALGERPEEPVEQAAWQARRRVR